MENLKNLIFLAVVIVSLCPDMLFAYSRNTHEGLTETTIKAYEQLRGDKITSAQEELMIKGSSAEDEGTRPLQHFYDPVNDRGLKVLLQWLSSKLWSQDTESQANYCDYGWCPKRIGYMDKPFSSPTDFSWDRAVYEYVHGDKSKAFEALGHMLHLIQDSTVPAHTRNDQHLNHQGFGDADPYESYTAQFVRGNMNIPTNISTPIFSTVAEAIDKTAVFTNKNFLSKDSVFERYGQPSLAALSVEGAFAVNQSGGKVARYEKIFNKSTGEFENRWLLSDEKNLVVSDYWSALSKEAIQNSIGVIDLFFEEIEKEKQTLVLKERNKSAAELKAIADARKGFKYVKALYGSSLSQDDVDELLGVSNQAGAAAAAFSTSEPQENVSTDAPIQIIEQSVATQSQQAQLVESVEQPAEITQAETVVPEPQIIPSISSPSPAPSQQPAPSQGLFSFPQGGGGGGGGGSSPAPAAPVEPALSLTVSSPVSGSSINDADVTFIGTTEPGATVYLLGKDTFVVADVVTGAWVINITLTEGEYDFEFIAEKAGTGSSETVDVNITVDTQGPTFIDFAVNDCAHSITFSTCTIPVTETSASWSASEDAIEYVVKVNGVALATTTTQSQSITLLADMENEVEITAYDGGGNASNLSVLVQHAIPTIYINEVAWAGTSATSAADWIELRNMSPLTLDLSSFKIDVVGSGFSQALTGSLAATSDGTNDDLYLIERATGSISAQHSQLMLAMNLIEAGDQVKLRWVGESSDVVIDTTPLLETCGGWCAGALAATIGTSPIHGTTTAPVSMERIGTDGLLASSWQNNDTYFYNGNVYTDSSGATVYGTPGKDNSLGKPDLGWFCNSDTTSIEEGATYVPDGVCTYLSRFIHTDANRYASTFKGVLGNAVSVATHSLAKTIEKVEIYDFAPFYPVQGDDFFIAIWELRTNVDSDFDNFKDYFMTGSTTSGSTEPPHGNYRILQWKYGP